MKLHGHTTEWKKVLEQGTLCPVGDSWKNEKE
jgi:hypothetical protein